MFLSNVFIEAFVNVTGLTLELYNTDGSAGAALGAGIGIGIYENERAAFSKLELLEKITPTPSLTKAYEAVYENWKALLNKYL